MIIAALVIFAGSAFSATLDATAEKVTGGAEYKKTDTAAWKVLETGTVVPTGSTIRTKADGECIIKWNGNAAKIGKLTVMKISEISLSANGTEVNTLDIQEGKVFAHAKKLATADSKFQLRTPTAVAGVRGTDLYGMMSGGQANFGVSEGSVVVEAGGVEVTLAEGLSVNVDPAGTMSAPMPIPVEIKQEVQQNAKEVKTVAQQAAPSAVEEKKEEKKAEAEEKKETATAEKTEEKTETTEQAAPEVDVEETTEEATEEVTENIDRILEEETTSDIVDEVERIYKSGTVDVYIYINSPQ